MFKYVAWFCVMPVVLITGQDLSWRSMGRCVITWLPNYTYKNPAEVFPMWYMVLINVYIMVATMHIMSCQMFYLKEARSFSLPLHILLIFLGCISFNGDLISCSYYMVSQIMFKTEPNCYIFRSNINCANRIKAYLLT